MRSKAIEDKYEAIIREALQSDDDTAFSRAWEMKQAELEAA
jgi:hypothetical protein